MGAGISYAGYRTGFPFPIVYGATIWDGTTYTIGGVPGDGADGVVVGDGTSHPLGFTFLQMVEYWWRVRQLKSELNLIIGIDYAGYVGSGTVAKDFFSTRTDFLDVPDYNEVSQAELWKLVRGTVPFSNQDDTVTYVVGDYSAEDGGSPPDTKYNNVEMPPGGMFGGLQTVYKVDELYYPSLNIIEIFTMVDLDIFWIYSSASINRVPVHTATLAGIGTFTLYKDDYVDHTLSGTYNILPVEWFGYGGKWNTTNGNRL